MGVRNHLTENYFHSGAGVGKMLTKKSISVMGLEIGK